MSRLPDRFRKDKEGQFLERKSCFNKRTKKPKPLPLKSVGAAIAETLVAFTNADGGELAVGLDDDGSASGLPFTAEQVAKLAEAPLSRVVPPLAVEKESYEANGQSVLVFTVGPSPVSHRTTAGKYLYRDHDRNLPMDAEQIAHLKALKRQVLTEHAIIPGAEFSDLREDLMRGVAEKLEPGLSNRDALLKLRLAEASNGHLRIMFAALLLFGKDPERWHPKAHVEYLRFRGTERGHGARLNMIGRQSIVAPLTELPQRVLEAVRPHIGQRQMLHDLFFTERAEYPQFAWEEALVNAVGHRDYGLRGTPIEIHHYEDRLEVISPGSPVPPVTIETLRQGGGRHASRNPLIVRVLTLLGLMREIGEGVRRMFAEMSDSGLRPPEFEDAPKGWLTVRLRNVPVWDEGTRAWLSRFKDHKLSQNQMRLLAMARQQEGRFTSAQYQKLAGIDIYSASQDIKELIRKGLVRLEKKGGRLYRLAEMERGAPPGDYRLLAGELAAKQSLANSDLRQLWGGDRQSVLRRAKRLIDAGWLRTVGDRKARRYLAGPKAG